jgi:hypothetical protein
VHRTQILLDDGQYLSLREAARGAGKSMGELIRQFVRQGLRQGAPTNRRKYRLKDLQGMVCEPGFDAADHDAVLYGDDA